jgi:hypothetical protein
MKYSKLPVFRKAKELLDVVQTIVEENDATDEWDFWHLL